MSHSRITIIHTAAGLYTPVTPPADAVSLVKQNHS